MPPSHGASRPPTCRDQVPWCSLRLSRHDQSPPLFLDPLVDVGAHSNRRVMSPASRVANHGSMVWLWTGVSSGNRPMFDAKIQKIPFALRRVPARTEYLEECRPGAAWESLGISEIAQQIR